MTLNFCLSTLLSYILILLAMAFFTLLERKILGYIQLRKGPNKVGLMGLPQPLADALKLFAKEQVFPFIVNKIPFFMAPVLGLILALALWNFYPYKNYSFPITFSVIIFLAISRLNVYRTLIAG